MDSDHTNERLPIYSSQIKGDLRTILQTKDLFILAYKYLEDYSALFGQLNSLFLKDFLEEQVYINEIEIQGLIKEVASNKKILKLRCDHNIQLIEILAGYDIDLSAHSPRRAAMTKLSHSKKLSVLPLNEDDYRIASANNLKSLIQEIDNLTKDQISLLDYYRELYYLETNFIVILSKICYGILPMITTPISVIDRVFFWNDRPELESLRNPEEVGDKLTCIYCRTQKVVSTLADTADSMIRYSANIKRLESEFRTYFEQYRHIRDLLLREIHASKVEVDIVEEENDRLIGVIVKLDPRFVDTNEFYDLGQRWIARNPLLFHQALDSRKESQMRSTSVRPNYNTTKSNQVGKTPEDDIPRVFSGELVAEFSSISSNDKTKAPENTSNIYPRQSVCDNLSDYASQFGKNRERHNRRHKSRSSSETMRAKSIDTLCTPTEYVGNILPNLLHKNNDNNIRKEDCFNIESVISLPTPERKEKILTPGFKEKCNYKIGSSTCKEYLPRIEKMPTITQSRMDSNLNAHVSENSLQKRKTILRDCLKSITLDQCNSLLCESEFTASKKS